MPDIITTWVLGAPLSSEETENISKNVFFLKILNTCHGHIIKVPVNKDTSLTRSRVNVIQRYSPAVNLIKLPLNINLTSSILNLTVLIHSCCAGSATLTSAAAQAPL